MPGNEQRNFPWWVVTAAAGVAATAFVYTTFITPYQNQKIEQLSEKLSITSSELNEARKNNKSLQEKNKLLRNQVYTLSKAEKEAAAEKKAADSRAKECDKVRQENMDQGSEILHLKKENQRISQALSKAKDDVKFLLILTDLQKQELKQYK
ncbi:MAG: hypothetical protein KQH53_18180 [Desulfarculaceae bacterium]|nr:hypothetical protein [Desulfarculaceae bacterium]